MSPMSTAKLPNKLYVLTCFNFLIRPSYMITFDRFALDFLPYASVLLQQIASRDVYPC